jgi:tetratricopeptide (TPR) repeat protein
LLPSASVPLLFLVLISCSRSPQHYLEKGNNLFLAGKYAEASINYRRAIQGNSGDGDAYYHLGLTSLKLGDSRGAIDLLSQAATLTPGRREVQVVLAETCIGEYSRDRRRPKQFYDEAVRMADELVSADANSYDGLRLKGMIAVIDHKLDESAEYFRRADRIRPMQPAVIVELSQVLASTSRAAEAESLLRELIQKEPAFQPGYQLLYRLLMGQHRRDEAESVLKLRADRNPLSMESWLDLARHYASISRWPEMTAALQHILSDPAHFPQGRLEAGAVYQAAGNRSEARRLFEEGAKQDSKNRVIYEKRVVGILLAENQRAEARKRLETILQSNPADEEAVRLDAELKLAEGTPESAAAAAAALQALAVKHSRSEQLQYETGRAWQVAGRIDDARVHFQQAAASRADYLSPRLALAELSLQTGNPTEALRYIEQVLAFDRHNPQVRLLRATALRLAGRTGESRSELGRLLTENPASADIQLQLGLVDVAEKRYAGAEATFRRFYKPNQQDLRPLVGLVQLFFNSGQPARGIQLLESELEHSSNPNLIRRALGRAALVDKNYDLAIEQFRVLAAASPGDASAQFDLGEAFRLKGNADAALQCYEKAVDLDPRNAAARISLAFDLKSIGRIAEAEAQYRQLLSTEPNNPQAQNGLAYLLGESGRDLDEALKYAELAVRNAPGEDRFRDTLGFVQLKKNMTDSATWIFQQLLEKAPNDPTFRLHLAMAYARRGQRELAKRELKAGIASHPDVRDLGRLQAMLSSL